MSLLRNMIASAALTALAGLNEPVRDYGPTPERKTVTKQIHSDKLAKRLKKNKKLFRA